MGIWSRNGVKKRLQESLNYIEYENFISAIERGLQGNCRFVTEEEMGNKEIVMQWNK
jgi:hypothetical protein